MTQVSVPARYGAGPNAHHTALTASMHRLPGLACGVVAVFLHDDTTTGMHLQRVLPDAASASFEQIPAAADRVVLIAVCDSSYGLEHVVAHLDVLSAAARTAGLAVTGQLHIPALQPGEVWADLADFDNPGGVLAP